MSTNAHHAHLLIGSNLSPEENVRQALLELCHYGIIKRISRVWQTPAYGSQGPDFLNLAVELVTPLSLESLKIEALSTIEDKLGRRRTADKNAPRTMDIDVILFDGELLDQTVWTRVHTAITICEILPDLSDSKTHEPLSTIAARLAEEHPVRERNDVLPLME
jgi:2-amino-4-hydroxy-6-hydroxymethyldihydropteridine diphosphokinase